MDTQGHSQKHRQPFIRLSSKAILSEIVPNTNHIFYALSKSNFCLIDLNQGQKLHESSQIHMGRIGCMRFKDNILMTGGTDNLIKLHDTRDWSLIHTFQKIPSRFTGIDKSQHILAASTNSNIVFWDLRKMKQRSEFNQSFNGEITYIKFQDSVGTNLLGCSLDGMINMFDLTQSNQQQAFNWCFKILESPASFSTSSQGRVLVKTLDYNIYKIQNGDSFGKISPNTPEKPKHVVFSQFKPGSNNQIYEYFAWSPEQRVVQHWNGNFFDKNNEQLCLGYLNSAKDVQLFDVMYSKDGKCIGVYTDQNGGVFISNFVNNRKPESLSEELQMQQLITSTKKLWNPKKKSIKEQSQPKNINGNGYMIQKPASSFSKHKKFKPY